MPRMPRMPRLGRDKLMDTILHLFKRSNTLDALKPEQRAFNAQWLASSRLALEEYQGPSRAEYLASAEKFNQGSIKGLEADPREQKHCEYDCGRQSTRRSERMVPSGNQRSVCKQLMKLEMSKPQ